MHTPFTVAGMSSSTGAHHSHGPTAWGSASSSGPLATSLSDTLSQSRTQYHPGYMMSASQNNASAQGNQRIEEAPLVKTKAKMNNTLLRGSASDFGMDSMFESSRQRKRHAFADEDAPPTNSVNDIPTEFHSESTTSIRFQHSNSILGNSSLQKRHPSNSTHQQQTLYVIVFGYPADKYSMTVEYFQSLGPTTDPDPNTEILNCFRMGYLEPADAMRAVRKNGEVLSGSWMVGAKWADSAQAEAVLGQLAVRGIASTPLLMDHIGGSPLQPSGSSPDDSPLSQRARTTATPTIGTPIKLAPSTLAFRKGDRNAKVPATQQRQQGPTPSSGTSGIVNGSALGQSPSRGVMSQVSDLIFGW